MQFFDEDCALGSQRVDDTPVVDNFMAHVDWRSPAHKRLLHNSDSALDAGAETARRGKQYLNRRLGHRFLRAAAPAIPSAMSGMRIFGFSHDVSDDTCPCPRAQVKTPQIIFFVG